MPAVTVVRAAEVEPLVRNDGLRVRRTVGSVTGFAPLEQAIVECPIDAGASASVGDVEQTLFVLSGRGTLEVDGDVHELAPEVGAYLPPHSRYELRSAGPEPLTAVLVTVPEPVSGPQAGPSVRRLSDQDSEQATAQREFRIVADPGCGLRSATHFVGYIPTQRAPDHFHTYDEVIYVLDGEGVMHAGELSEPLSAGSCIQLPARTVHCLENTGDGPMRVVAVFRPAGSPAAAFYPDGTPAYTGPPDEQQDNET